MDEFADLELGLHRHFSDFYSVDFRYSKPGSAADVRLGQGKPILVQFDQEALNTLRNSPAAYGRALTDCLFSDPILTKTFGDALASAATLNVPLRLRLFIGATAPELHALRWETLNNPINSTPLCTNQNLLFSRYLGSADWRPMRLREQTRLGALVAAANPIDLSEYEDMAEVDTKGEIARARTALGAVAVTALPSPERQRVTLGNIIGQIAQDAPDIFYLACHGTLKKDEPLLWLEDEDGRVRRVPGEELVLQLKELRHPPRLVVLASCQSAGAAGSDALMALGPQLAEAGIPAVLAMQGNITMKTVSEMMPVFFTELQKHGYVDLALSTARAAVRDAPDYWMPVLFMRLNRGRIWSTPGFGRDFDKWPALISSIWNGNCTPILGHGMVESLFGSQREIASGWAEAFSYPLAPHERESLPQVAQFLAVNQGSSFPYGELENHLRQKLQSNYREVLPPPLLEKRASLDKLIEAVWLKQGEDHSSDSYRVLAKLPLPIFLTTNINNLLEKSLHDEGKKPESVLCPWNEFGEDDENVFDREPDYVPSIERPLIYHLFGRLTQPDSVVLTEDDYFDFLIGVTSNKDLIPKVVRRALADSALLILGFQLDEWNFRVLFRSILSQQGGGRRKKYAHIAAQIDPEEGRTLSPARARQYLEQYFSQDTEINIYWGKSEDFIRDLGERFAESQR